MIDVPVCDQYLMEIRSCQRGADFREVSALPVPASIKVGILPGTSHVQLPSPVIGPGLNAKIGIGFKRTPSTEHRRNRGGSAGR